MIQVLVQDLVGTTSMLSDISLLLTSKLNSSDIPRNDHGRITGVICDRPFTSVAEGSVEQVDKQVADLSYKAEEVEFRR